MAGHDLSKQGDAQLTFEHFNVPTIRQLHTRQSREEGGNGAKAHVSRRHLTLREIKAPFWIGRPALHVSSPPTVLLGVARTRKLKIVRPAGRHHTTPMALPWASMCVKAATARSRLPSLSHRSPDALQHIPHVLVHFNAML
jgi:hypothetical protein